MQPFGNGLVYRAWKVTLPGGVFILQQVKASVFTEPEAIAYNIRLLGINSSGAAKSNF
jgi:hypothetical protein